MFLQQLQLAMQYMTLGGHPNGDNRHADVTVHEVSGSLACMPFGLATICRMNLKIHKGQRYSHG